MSDSQEANDPVVFVWTEIECPGCHLDFSVIGAGAWRCPRCGATEPDGKKLKPVYFREHASDHG